MDIRELLGDLYEDLVKLTNNNSKKITEILFHYADKSGFFERIKEHIEYLEECRAGKYNNL